MRVIRASEVSEYLYCRRAWWLHQVRGYTSSQGQRLAEGTSAHSGHGRRVGLVWWLRILSIVLFIAALVVLLRPLLWR
jgi:hypothetical protein